MSILETNNSAYRKLAYPTEIKNMMTKLQKSFQKLHNLIGKEALSQEQRRSYYKLAAVAVLGDRNEEEIQNYTNYRMNSLQNVSVNEEPYTLLNQYPLLMTEKEEEEKSIENDHTTSIGNQHE